MKVTPVAIAVLVLSSFLMAHAQATQWSHGWSKAFMSEKYSQRISSSQNTAYPKWDPGESACPLHPTNAVSLAKQAASGAFTNVVDWELSSLSLQMTPLRDDSSVWFYDVSLRPLFDGEKPERVSCISVVVGLNGIVPEIKKGGTRSTGSYAESLRRRREELRKTKGLTEEDLRQYQMDLTRQGKPPMPIPLTPEMDKKLVEEGVLPPLDTEEEKVQPEN